MGWHNASCHNKKVATMASDTNTEQWVALARSGDDDALNRLLASIQAMVYKLAVRMLGHPEDARDACQDILVKVVAGLPDFRAESLFTTWVFRLASNHLLSVLRRPSAPFISFEVLAEQIDAGMSVAERFTHPAADDALIAHEMMASCTQKMLLGLDSAARIAYVLGDICDIDSDQAAQILEITPASFRQRLSRARAQLVAFTEQRCGLIDPAKNCRCAKQAGPAIAVGRLDPQRLVFAVAPGKGEGALQQPQDLHDAMAELTAVVRIARVLRAAHVGAVPSPEPGQLVSALKDMLASGQYRILS
jgi:RNA polymerase sigma factor (sigma-70 family)